MGFSRRDFVKAAGMGAVALGLPGGTAREAAAQGAADTYKDWLFISDMYAHRVLRCKLEYAVRPAEMPQRETTRFITTRA